MKYRLKKERYVRKRPQLVQMDDKINVSIIASIPNVGPLIEVCDTAVTCSNDYNRWQLLLTEDTQRLNIKSENREPCEPEASGIII